jgi:hypothetical protein
MKRASSEKMKMFEQACGAGWPLPAPFWFWLGHRVGQRDCVRLCPRREERITAENATLAAYAIPTDEELLIARGAVRVIEGRPHPS